MMQLSKALRAWQTPAFRTVLKDEIEHLDGNLLPLQRGLSHSSNANTEQFSATILNVTESADSLLVKAGLFYTGILAGCSCADDPTAVSEINEYCEVRFDIDRSTAETVVTLLLE